MKRVARQFAQRGLSPKLEPGLNGIPLQEEIVRVAAAFVDLQQHRHEADYDMGRSFTRLEVLSLINDAGARLRRLAQGAPLAPGRHVPRRTARL